MGAHDNLRVMEGSLGKAIAPDLSAMPLDFLLRMLICALLASKWFAPSPCYLPLRPVSFLQVDSACPPRLQRCEISWARGCPCAAIPVQR